MHVWGTYDAPGIAFPAGNLMACCHGFTIEVEGKSAHASAPHEGVDAVMVASSILQSIQQLVSRMNDPLNPLVITVGKVTAGNRWNVLAGHATPGGHRAYLPHRARRWRTRCVRWPSVPLQPSAPRRP